MTGHLSTRQIEELIINGADLQTRGHLITCEACRSEWGRLDEALQQYKSCATLAADFVISSQPPFTFPAFRSRRKSLVLKWACASTLFFALIIPFYEHHREQQQHAAEIARDNLLMEQVDLAVSEPVPQPLDSLRHLVVTVKKTTNTPSANSTEKQ